MPSEIFNAELETTWEKDQRRLMGQALRLMGSKEKAEDLLSDTIKRALEKWDKYEPETNMYAWLTTLLTHTRINQTRRAISKLETRTDSLDQLDPDQSESPRAPLRVRGGLVLSPVEETILSGIGVANINTAINNLPSAQARTMRLVCLEEQPYAQVADDLGIAMGTVASRINRGRAGLRALGLTSPSGK